MAVSSPVAIASPGLPEPSRGEDSPFARDVAAGLSAARKSLPCRYFYDAEGSRLFEAICALPEYYLTRAERSILAERSGEIAAQVPAEALVVELGSGSSVKTRLVLEALLAKGQALRYVPIDISPSILAESSAELTRDYPRLEVCPIADEYAAGLEWLHTVSHRAKLVLWLGSTIGNLDPAEAATFLCRVRHTMGPDDLFLVGADLRKDRATLEAAYDDAQGVTAAFNLNLLCRINRELGGGFDLRRFRHRARWNDADGRVEMHLESECRQSVRIEALGRTFSFLPGETIHTENSHKFTLAQLERIAADAGLTIQRQWLDGAGRFSLNMLAPANA